MPAALSRADGFFHQMRKVARPAAAPFPHHAPMSAALSRAIDSGRSAFRLLPGRGFRQPLGAARCQEARGFCPGAVEAALRVCYNESQIPAREGFFDD